MTDLKNYKPVPDGYEPVPGETVLVEVCVSRKDGHWDHFEDANGSVFYLADIIAINCGPLKIGDRVRIKTDGLTGVLAGVWEDRGWVKIEEVERPFDELLDNLERIND